MKTLMDCATAALRLVAGNTGRLFSLRAFLTGGILFFLTAQSLMATGTVKGTVVDRDTKDALPGATVLIRGTSVGASTDLNGNYTIYNAPSGSQTIVITYVGYRSTSEQVIIPDGQTLQKDFALEATAVQGKTVIVTAQAQGQMQAINQQLASNKIVSVVSSAKIQELPDFNAAAAISRLPGVSVTRSSGEASKVVIRGLAPQYNEVAVSGVPVASTGSAQIGATSHISAPGANGGPAPNSISSDRSVDLTMVTPYMIKSIEVYKTLTPDMNANAIGGYVNMQLREAPSGVHGDVLWQSGYTQKSNTYGNYRAVASGSNRFFNDKLGVYVLGNAEQYDRNADNMNATYTIPYPDSVKVTVVGLQRHIETRKRYGANLILDFRLPSGSIRSINMISRLNSNYQDYTERLYYQNRQLAWTYVAGNQNTDLAVNTLNITNDFGFMSVDLLAANTYSRNHLPEYPDFQFHQQQSYPPTPLNTPPEDLSSETQYQGDSVTTLDNLGLFSSDYHENDQIYRGDFKIPLNLGTSVSGFIKFGGEYRYNYHTNDQSTPYGSLSGSTTPGPTADPNTIMGDSIVAHYPQLAGANGKFTANYFTTPLGSSLYDSFLNNKFGKIYWVVDPSILNFAVRYLSSNPTFRAVSGAGGWYDGIYQNYPNDYKYIERYYAAYLMSELDIGPDFMVVGGARYEQDKSLFFAWDVLDDPTPSNQRAVAVTAYPQNHYWLPMVQVKYGLFDWADIRYAYTQTLARPSYSQLTPHFYMDYSHNNVWAGNPDLRPAQAYNHDLEITIHSNDIGLITIGGFYKSISHFAFSTSYPLLDNSNDIPAGFDSTGSFVFPGTNVRPNQQVGTVYTFLNSPYKAYVRGIEADFQTRFWYLPSPLDGVVLGINYTHISSSATYPFLFLRTVDNPTPPPRFKTVLIDSSRSGRLIDQPNDIMNAYIGYDYKGFSARVSFLFQGNSVSYVGNWPQQDGFTKNYFRIDASARQTLPWIGAEIYLDANNLNSESNISAQQTIGGFTNQQYYGLTADIGIRIRL